MVDWPDVLRPASVAARIPSQAGLVGPLLKATDCVGALLKAMD